VSTDLDDLQLEPELTAEEFALELEPLPADNNLLPAATAAPEPAALMQVLPADFPLPALIRFVPDPALRSAADQAAKYALSLEVQGPEGVQRADAACTALRQTIRAIETHFDEPKDIANRLHKQITSTLGDWTGPGKAALQTVGGRVAREQSRLQAEAAAARRKAQEEEDRKERERRRAEAEAAAKAQAPAPVVQELKRQAETATAPPVPEVAAPPKLADSTVVKTWKARIAGTPASDNPNPSTAELTPPQRAKVLDLLGAIIRGDASLALVDLNWSAINARAKAEKSAFAIAGLESFEDIGLRSKGTRSR
jgi:hypothetical protein